MMETLHDRIRKQVLWALGGSGGLNESVARETATRIMTFIPSPPSKVQGEPMLDKLAKYLYSLRYLGHWESESERIKDLCREQAAHAISLIRPLQGPGESESQKEIRQRDTFEDNINNFGLFEGPGGGV